MEEKLKKIYKKFGITFLYAFGNRAKGASNFLKGKKKKLKKSFSDLNIAIVPKEGFFDFAKEKFGFCLEVEYFFGIEEMINGEILK